MHTSETWPHGSPSRMTPTPTRVSDATTCQVLIPSHLIGGHSQGEIGSLRLAILNGSCARGKFVGPTITRRNTSPHPAEISHAIRRRLRVHAISDGSLGPDDRRPLPGPVSARP